MDPLVEEYLRKKQGLDQGVTDARTKADWMDAGSQVGQGLADLVQPRNQVIYEKGWNETGAPKIENVANKAADFSGLKTMGQRELQAAQENRNQGLQDFDQTQKLTDLSTNRERDAVKFGNAQATFGLDVADKTQMMNKRAQDMANDKEMNTPGSPQAKEFAKFMQQAIPGSPDLSDLSPARQKELTGNLFDQWKLLNKPVEAKPTDPKAVERLGKDTDELAGILNSFDDIVSMSGDTLHTGLKGQRNQPGWTWPIAGRITAFSPEAKQRESAIAAITNRISKANFGAAQSKPELLKLNNELAAGKFNTEAEREDALARLRNLFIKSTQQSQAKYPEDVRNTYKQQGGLIGSDVPLSTPTAASGATGTFKPIDQMTREEKLKELQELGGG